MPPNYREQRGLPLQPHERKAGIWLAGLLVAACAGVGGWLLASGGGGAGGAGGSHCVQLTIPSSTGGGTIHQCGHNAKTFCAAQSKEPGPLALEIRAACRKAGFA